MRVLQFGGGNRLHDMLMIVMQDLVVSPDIFYAIYTNYMIGPFYTAQNGQMVIDGFVFGKTG